MKLGICVPNTHETLADPATMVAAAQRAEAHGFDSLWVNDHVVVPSTVTSEAADRQSQYLDRREQRIFEPLVLLSYLAARTERITLGTSVFVLALRNPVIAAKQVATLDVLSGGRVILGVGVGWMQGEFAALAVPYAERGRRTDLALRLAKALWHGDAPVDVDSDHDLAAVVFNPLPTQRPHPPVWIGGRTEVSARRAARLGDAWHPSHLTISELRSWRPRLDALCAETGRDPGQVGITTRRRVHPLVTPTEPLDERRSLQGQPADVIEDLDALASVGVDHLVMELDAPSPAALLEQIDWLGTEVLAAATPVPTRAGDAR